MAQANSRHLMTHKLQVFAALAFLVAFLFLVAATIWMP